MFAASTISTQKPSKKTNNKSVEKTAKKTPQSSKKSAPARATPKAAPSIADDDFFGMLEVPGGSTSAKVTQTPVLPYTYTEALHQNPH